MPRRACARPTSASRGASRGPRSGASATGDARRRRRAWVGGEPCAKAWRGEVGSVADDARSDALVDGLALQDEKVPRVGEVLGVADEQQAAGLHHGMDVLEHLALCL